MNILSLMSGSSLDGIDIGIIKFVELPDSFKWEICYAQTIPYSDAWKERLFSAVGLSAKSLLTLHAEYAVYNAEVIHDYFKSIVEPIECAAISFHGHTIFHEVEKGFSFQLGCCATLAALTNRMVVGDFRSMDVALGGQGAPLMALADEMLFNDFPINLNLGGICNLSYKSLSEYVAYDIAPCNQLLNALAGLKGLEYDRDGHIASSGSLDPSFLEFLHSDPYYSKNYPKSLDNNYIREQILSAIPRFDSRVEDLMFSACYFIVDEIERSLRIMKQHASFEFGYKMLVTGGGALNKTLIDMLKSRVKNIQVETKVPHSELIEYKELLLMGLLAYYRLLGKHNVYSKYTGASRNTISAAIYEGKN